jgi:hypothetical protein
MEGGGPDHGRDLRIIGQTEQAIPSLGVAAAAGLKDFSIVGLSILQLSIPFLRILRGPLIGLVPVIVAQDAGVGNFESVGQVRARNPHAVIPAWIDHHVGTLPHVALDTQGARGFVLVKMVGMRSKFLGEMASVAERVSLSKNASAVRLVAVPAGYAGHVHLAL